MSDQITTVLPPHSTLLEKAIEAAAMWTVRNVTFPKVNDPDECPPELLSWLAWAVSVDDWDNDWPVETKRKVIRESFEIHRRKGTIGSVRAAISAFGFGNAVILEGTAAINRDGTSVRDGTEVHGTERQWAEYTVRVSRPITTSQAAQLSEILAEVAPARCHLVALDFAEVAKLHDNTFTRDGTFTRGTV